MTYRVIPCFLHVPIDAEPFSAMDTVRDAIADEARGVRILYAEDLNDRAIEDSPETFGVCHTLSMFQTLPEIDD
jgi:hypothetical protein